MTTVAMEPMNHQNIVRAKVVHALETYLLATTAIAYHEFIFATVIMIVWITATKIIDINAVSKLTNVFD